MGKEGFQRSGETKSRHEEYEGLESQGGEGAL